MKVKRFFAPDMSAAMRLVRDEVGPDAVILSNNSVAGGVEVVVALEYQDYAGTRAIPSRPASERPGQGRPLVGQKKPSRSPSFANAAQSRSSEALQRAGRPSSTSLEALVRQAEAVQTPSHKDRQLTLEDVSWDEVLESLNRRAEQKRQERQRQQQPRRQLKSAGVTSTPALERAQALQSKMAAAVVEPEGPSATESFEPELDIESLLNDGPSPKAAAPSARSQRPAPPPVDVSNAMSAASQEDDGIADLQAHSEKKMLQAMRSEIDELKSILRTRLKDTASQANAEVAKTSNPVRDRIRKRLRRLNVEDRLSSRLVQAIEADTPLEKAWKTSLSRLADALPSVGENLAERGGILAFVGATGVGKTTSIGKLATQYVLKHGSSSVALVTTDSFRIAAHEQLKTFGRILDIPVRVVDQEHSLDDILHNLRDKRLILVDTSGLSTSEQQRQLQMDMLQSSSYRIKKLLVLPATSQYRILKSCYDHFKPLGLNGAVLTKVDESVSLGEALSLLVEQRLPLAYVADGQKVPDDIAVARSNSLVSRAVVLAEQQARADRAALQQQADQQPLFNGSNQIAGIGRAG